MLKQKSIINQIDIDNILEKEITFFNKDNALLNMSWTKEPSGYCMDREAISIHTPSHSLV